MKTSQLEILYEDEYMLAVNKPARVMTVPADSRAQSAPAAKNSQNKSMIEIVQKAFEEKDFRPYLLHRLDMDTSGVLLFGKNPKHRKELENILKDEKTKKFYVALVRGVPRNATITHALKSRYKGEAEKQKDKESSAVTDFKVFKTFSLWKGQVCAMASVKILTGRKHQIRQHFQHIGFPVVMDEMYGDKNFNRRFRLQYGLSRQFLHAEKIEFFHPFLQKNILINAPLAYDLKAVVGKMSGRR
ncbi:MAG: RluA family pseudouridine synthase [Patescibacteria group bacterium]